MTGFPPGRWTVGSLIPANGGSRKAWAQERCGCVSGTSLSLSASRPNSGRRTPNLVSYNFHFPGSSPLRNANCGQKAIWFVQCLSRGHQGQRSQKLRCFAKWIFRLCCLPSHTRATLGTASRGEGSQIEQADWNIVIAEGDTSLAANHRCRDKQKEERKADARLVGHGAWVSRRHFVPPARTTSGTTPGE
jgi:hypothetical protein